jgi:dihydrofolate reductase
MALPDRIEGYAIVSADHMLADANGVQPDALKPEADQKFFYGALDRAAAVVHGRHSAEGGPRAAARRRIIATRRVPALAPVPDNPNAVLWNPAGASFEAAWEALGLSGGLVAVIGGTEVFGEFLGRYHAFHLSRLPGVRLPGGRPVFPGIPPATPEAILRKAGLSPGPARTLDPAIGLTLISWTR